MSAIDILAHMEQIFQEEICKKKRTDLSFFTWNLYLLVQPNNFKTEFQKLNLRFSINAI